MYRRFARQYNWTPAQVDALPPEFVDEQLAIWGAISEFEARQPKLRGKK